MTLFDIGLGTLADLARPPPSGTGALGPLLSTGLSAVPTPSHAGLQVGPAREISLVKVEINLRGK